MSDARLRPKARIHLIVRYRTSSTRDQINTAEMRELRPYTAANIVSTERRTFGKQPSSLHTPKAKGYLILINAHPWSLGRCGVEDMERTLAHFSWPRRAATTLEIATGRYDLS